MLTRRSTIRRLLASLMLASIALFFMTPLLAATVALPGDCPPAPAGRGPVLVAGMDGAACEHTDAGLCVTALGCVSIAPAVRPAPAVLVNSPRLTVVGVAPIAPAGDLYRTGPPTPPPNHI
jgi:hypothetical protein